MEPPRWCGPLATVEERHGGGAWRPGRSGVAPLQLVPVADLDEGRRRKPAARQPDPTIAAPGTDAWRPVGLPQQAAVAAAGENGAALDLATKQPRRDRITTGGRSFCCVLDHDDGSTQIRRIDAHPTGTRWQRKRNPRRRVVLQEANQEVIHLVWELLLNEMASFRDLPIRHLHWISETRFLIE
ncbi:unnamed protein product [Urochloa humidicola]